MIPYSASASFPWPQYLTDQEAAAIAEIDRETALLREQLGMLKSRRHTYVNKAIARAMRAPESGSA